MQGIPCGIVLPYVDPQSAVELAREAEDAGWDGIFMGDAVWTLDPLILLTAAALATSRILLGTLVLAAPLHTPWRLASQSAALDIASGGRLILGLGTGATWMGWQAFPDEPTDIHARAGMLGETIDILTRLYAREPFDYHGRYYHLKLSLLDPVHYPPKPVQQPRIPLWAVGAWPRRKSMERVLKCDGVIAAKMDAAGGFCELTQADVREIKAFAAANRTETGPFDIVVEGKSGSTSQERADTVGKWVEAGATWWIESTWGLEKADLLERIRQGKP